MTAKKGERAFYADGTTYLHGPNGWFVMRGPVDARRREKINAVLVPARVLRSAVEAQERDERK